MQKADKGNTVVILDKEYSKFERLEILLENRLKFVINSWEKIKNILKNLRDKESLIDTLYKNILPVECRTVILYGQAKVQKRVINNSPSFRPILGAIDTPL